MRGSCGYGSRTKNKKRNAEIRLGARKASARYNLERLTRGVRAKDWKAPNQASVQLERWLRRIVVRDRPWGANS